MEFRRQMATLNQTSFTPPPLLGLRRPWHLCRNDCGTSKTPKVAENYIAATEGATHNHGRRGGLAAANGASVRVGGDKKGIDELVAVERSKQVAAGGEHDDEW